MSTHTLVPPGPITIEQVQKQICQAGKAISVRQIQRYFSALGIKCLGKRQKPNVYPSNAADRVLTHLGLNGEIAAHDGRVVSLNKLKSERAKATKSWRGGTR